MVRPRREPLRAREPPGSRVLVYRIGQLGDTIVAVPAMRAVAEAFRGARLSLLCDRQVGKDYVLAADLLAGAGIFDEFESYPAGGLLGRAGLGFLRAGRLLLALRRKRYDAVVYLAPSLRTPRQVERDRRFFALAGIRRFYGFRGFPSPAARRPGLPLVRQPREADLLLARLRADGLAVPPPGRGSMELGLGEAERAEARRFLRRGGGGGGRPRLAVAPGSKMPVNRWPFTRYAQAVARLVREYDLWPVVLGGPEDERLGRALVARWGRGANGAGSLGIRAAAAVLERCVLHLGNDSGCTHLAAAVGTPCVAVFSARQAPGLWFPYGTGHVVLRESVACEGCGLVRCVAERMRCVTAIGVEEVLEACRGILARRGISPAAVSARAGERGGGR